jgi:hypothetical protein
MKAEQGYGESTKQQSSESGHMGRDGSRPSEFYSLETHEYEFLAVE